MKIRRSIIVLLVLMMLLVPITLYRALFSADASAELVSAVDIIFKVLMAIFLLLNFSFSIFTDDYPHSYNESKNLSLGLISVLVAAVIGYTSALGLISSEFEIYSGIPGKVFSLLGIMTVLAFMFYAVTYFKGENIITAAALVPIFPTLLYGFRLLFSFLESASMADISNQLLLIASNCAFTIFTLTIGKLFSCSNSYSVKWAFMSGCTGVLCTFIYFAQMLPEIIANPTQLISAPIIMTDLAMSLFAVGSLIHISVPAKYFDDEEWDDYFYETYDLPKPNLILHTPVDELEEDTYSGDEIDEKPYIPVSASVNSRPSKVYAPNQTAVPSYIANPALYNPATMQPLYPYPPAYPPVQQPYYPPPAYPQAFQSAQPPYYPPAYPPAQPPYYPPAYPPAAPTAVPDPYDSAALQYQYERRRIEMKNRELEQLTGQVDQSIARLDSSLRPLAPAQNQVVTAAPDEASRQRTMLAPSQSLRPASSSMKSGERLTDHLDKINREAQQQQSNQSADSDDEYTYEYYYPNTNQTTYSPNQFNPYRPSSGSDRK